MQIVLKTTLFLLLIFGLTFIINDPPYAKDWHEEFEHICSKVQTDDALSIEELKSLIERSEALLKIIENLDEPSKKMYIFRLKKCKAFFEYLIELKKSTTDNPAP